MFYLLLVTYILGGITLIPLLGLAATAYAFYNSVAVPPTEHRKRVVTAAPPNDDDSRASPPLKTWLTVRSTFEASPTSYISIVRTLLDARAARTRRAEDAYYAVLKREVLYLYEDEAMSECAAAIDVRRCDVRIVPDDDVLLDGELFAKRNAVLLHEKDSSISATPGSDVKQSPISDFDNENDAAQTPDGRTWYIFFRSAHDMEDWYFAFLNAPAPFPHLAQRDLIDALDALPDRIPTRWLNALLGRLFLGVKGTRILQNWVVGRLMKKLGKVKTPSWLTAVVIRSFDAGDVPPVLSKPMLKELTPEGDASVGVDISYIAPQDGGIRITISATAAIALPAPPSFSMLGFKNKDKEKEQAERPYEVSLVLAVIVRRVEGNMLVKIKRAPSNRLWYAFTTMPRMDIEVKPVVSDRQIRWGMVLSGIEGKLREIIQDSVVLPNMDDIPFFDTSSLSQRGGIFADAFPSPDPAPGIPPEPRPPAELPTELRRTRSTEALVVDGMSAEESGELSPSEPDPEVLRAETIALGVSSGRSASGSVRKRRTWFGGRQSEDSGEGGDGGEGDGDRERLRKETRAMGDREMGGQHRRGHSEDATAVRVLVTRDDNDDAPRGPVQDRPSLPPRRQGSRSVSDASPYVPRDNPSPSPSPPPTAESGLSRSAPTTSLPSPSSSTPSTPNAPSFLATLKSRGAGMAEKQPALKEAMRKWGGTWAAALRKNEREKEREKEREEADYGEVWAGEVGRSASPRGSPRGSYADLRRKVEQRERERAREGSGSDSGARPIDIPRAREGDVSTLERRTSSTGPNTLSQRTGSDYSIPTTRVSPPATAQFLTPSAPKTTTELHTSLRAPSPTPMRSPPSATTSISPSGAVTPLVPTESSTPTRLPATIRAQPPKAATMTIPGIHARHRGDLMGFGSVPPATPSSQEAGKTVQNMYRLIRGNAGSEGGERDEEPQTPSTAKPVPPPLPPRTPAVPADSASSVSLSESTTSIMISPASQALKSLAEQDAAARQPPSSRASTSPAQSPRTSISEDPPVFLAQEGAQGNGNAGWKPPLPPRPKPVQPQERSL